MEENYSIDDILSAVEDLQDLKKDKSNKFSNIHNSKSDKSNIPKDTLKLIEEAEKSNR